MKILIRIAFLKLFILSVPSKDAFSEESKFDTSNTTELKPKSNTLGTEITSNHTDDDTRVNNVTHSSLKSVRIHEAKKNANEQINNNELIKVDDLPGKSGSHPMSAISKFSEQVRKFYFNKFIYFSLLSYLFINFRETFLCDYNIM